MKVIGITGGVGCGKSTVLDIIESNFNAFVIKADDVAKELMEKDKKGYCEIVDFFGMDILDSDREIDRAKLAGIIFNNPNKRMVLNSIIHPMVKSQIVATITELKIEDRYDYVFVEAALLLEDHYDVFLDEIWYVYAPEDMRTERLMDSRGYTKERIQGMMESQLSETEFRLACDKVVDNSGTKEETYASLVNLLQM